MRTPHRILVVRTDRLGDVVLATPLIRSLRQTFPSAFIAAMVRPYAKDILINNPHLNEIVVDDDAKEGRGHSGFWRQVRTLRLLRFDTALLLLPTERAAWMLFFAGIPRRVGVGTKLYGVLTFMGRVSRNKYIPLRHEADYCMDLGRKIGVESEDLTTEVFLTHEERAEGLRLLRSAGARDSCTLVGVHPGSGGSSPNWDGKRYAALVESLLANGQPDIRLVLTGEESNVPFPQSEGVIDLRGKLSLRELMAVLSHFHSFFSSSTGPMHIAAALKVPTVSMFCPLPACSPTLWGPKGNSARIILPPEGFCEGRCPGDPKVCRFEEISVEVVATTILETITTNSNVVS
ncbi:MAG: glycosyltransferase family 9 protein [Ignavibacteriae bacterium]|nr:glycosyltransferase family 9 protein [Ignavibacteriota bacterium]